MSLINPILRAFVNKPGLQPFPYTAATVNVGGGLTGPTAPGGTSPSGFAIRRYTEDASNGFHYLTYNVPGTTGKTVTVAIEYRLDPGATHSVNTIRSETGSGAGSWLTDTGAEAGASGSASQHTTDIGGGWRRLEVTLPGDVGAMGFNIVPNVSGSGSYQGVITRYYDLGNVGFTLV